MGTDTDRDRDDTGQYADRIPPERVLDAFDARDDRARPLTAGDVAEYLDIARRTAHNKLNRLTDREELKTRKVGAKGRVWWTPALADESRVESGQEPAVTPSADTADPTGTSADSRRESAHKILTDLDRAGEGTDYDRRRGAVLQMYEHLRATPGDRLGKQDFEDLLAGEEVGYDGGFTSLWSNWVKADEKRGRPENALAVLPGVELRGDDYVYQAGGDE